MNKTFILIAALLAIASCQHAPEGSVRECVADIKEAITLAQQVKADFEAKNLTALVNDATAVFSLYERASTNCDFSKEQLEFNLAKCLGDIRQLIPLIKQTQADFDARNITALLDDGVAIYELVNLINEDCSNEARELFDLEMSLAATPFEVEIVNPVKCVKHAANFTGQLRQFVREERNHSLTPEQTFNQIWILVNDIPEVFHDCGLPVPAFFNNTKALQNCTVALYDLYEDIVKIDNDINNKDIGRIIEDVQSIITAVGEIKNYCQIPSQEDIEEDIIIIEDETEEEELGSLAECVQAVESLVAGVEKFEADDAAHPADVPLLVADVEAIWSAFENTLNHCGEGKIEEIIQEYLSDQCVKDVGNLIDKAYDIYEEKDSAIAHWRQFAEDVIEFVHDIQRVQDDCVPQPQPGSLEAFNFFEKEEEYQFNITECLQQSETVAADLDSLISDVNQARSQGINPVEIEAITKDAFTLLDNILYDFVPACAGSAAEDEIEHYLPEECLNAIENVTILIEDIAEHDRDVKYILTSLPNLYEDLVAIGKNCENTIGLFMKPFYKVAEEIR
jgi:hypothetical protein